MALNAKRLLYAFCIFIAVFSLGYKKTLAATITVTDSTSTVGVDSSCSLREALQNANDNAATNVDCAAGSGTDTIDLQTDVHLDTADHNDGVSDFGLPSPTEAVIIEGNNHTIDRTASSDMQLLDSPEDLTLQNLTISIFH